MAGDAATGPDEADVAAEAGGDVPRPGRRRLAVGLMPVAAGSFAALGLRDAALGVAWPSVRQTFDQPLGALGTVLIAGTIGALLGSLASGRVQQRFGPRAALAGLTAIAVVAMAVVTVAPAWLAFVAGMAIVGVSGGGTDASLNTVMALRYGVRGLGLVHAAFGAGAIAGPLVMAVVISAFDSWRLGYAVLVALYLVVVVGFLAVDWEQPGGVVEQTAPVGHAVAASRYRAALACSVLLFFVYVGVESCAAQWAYSLFTEDRGIGTVAAGIWVGAFWAGFTSGRVLTGVLGHRVRRVRLLDSTLVLAAAGAALFWWNPANPVGGVGLVLLGLGLAAIYPTLVSLTPRRVGHGRAPRAIGYQVAAAVVGFALVPAGFGIVAEGSGLELLGPVLLAGVGAVAVLHRVAAGLEAT